MPQALPTAVEIGDSVIFQTLNDELILLKVTDQGYFGLNSAGAFMWKTLMDCGDLATANERLAAHYDADSSRINQDLKDLVAELLAKGLLKASGGEQTPAA